MPELHPNLVLAREKILKGMLALGFSMKQIQGVRTEAEQYELYRQGRETVGPDPTAQRPLGRTVTECDGVSVKSHHQVQLDGYGHAIDMCFTGSNPWVGPWDLYGAMVEALGLRWGGRFPKVDRPHMELKA